MCQTARAREKNKECNENFLPQSTFGKWNKPLSSSPQRNDLTLTHKCYCITTNVQYWEIDQNWNTENIPAICSDRSTDDYDDRQYASYWMNELERKTILTLLIHWTNVEWMNELTNINSRVIGWWLWLVPKHLHGVAIYTNNHILILQNICKIKF